MSVNSDDNDVALVKPPQLGDIPARLLARTLRQPSNIKEEDNSSLVGYVLEPEFGPYHNVEVQLNHFGKSSVSCPLYCGGGVHYFSAFCVFLMSWNC